MERPVRYGLVALLALAALLALRTVWRSRHVASTGQTDSAETIRIGTNRALGTVSPYVTRDAGFFQQNNLQVDIIDFNDVTTLMEAFASGQIDVALVGIAPSAIWQEKGVSLKIVASANGGGHVLLTRSDTGINDLTGLKGKKVATPKSEERRCYSPGRVLEPFGNYVLRAAFNQNLRLRNLPEIYLANVFHLVRELTELASGPQLVGNSSACTGADTCKLGICLSKGALSATEEKLKTSDLDLNRIQDFRLNLSGCPNTCGQHMLADLGFFGSVGRREQQMFPAYMVVAGAEIGEGKARLARQIDRVSARDLPEFVHEILKLWIARKDSYPSFAAYVDGEGTQEIRDITDRFRAIPAFSVDKSYYYDWGARDAFSLAARGVGECSAGLFDLIEVDLKSARDLREEFRSGESQGEDALYAIVLRSARALLITRGIEPSTDSAVFEGFAKHFVQSGLIDTRFEPVIAAAQRKDTEALSQLEEEVFALLNAVEALYRRMDNSLRFVSEAKD